MGLSEMGTGAGLCVWLATDEKLGDPPPKTALALLGSVPKPTISKVLVPCVQNYSLLLRGEDVNPAG